MSETEEILYRELCIHRTNPLTCLECESSNFVVAITDGPIVTENITIDRHYQFLQQIKSLRASIKDLQESLVKVQESEDGFYCEETIMPEGHTEMEILDVDKIAREALDRLKASGNYQEANSK